MQSAQLNYATPTTSKRWSTVPTLLSALLYLSLLSSGVAAQTSHSVTLVWTASADASANPTLSYNVYRLNGACPASAPTAISGSGFSKVNTASIATTTFSDTTVSPGTYCYFATAFLNATESLPSNDASGILDPAVPTSLGVSRVVQMVQAIVPRG